MSRRSAAARALLVCVAVAALHARAPEPQRQAAGYGTLAVYQNPDRPTAERVSDLIARMTLEEKVSQLMHGAAAIPRLGVPQYNWWNEGLHGVARAGLATVFPQAIGLAATWNTDLMGRVATVISDEARAKHHRFAGMDQRGLYQGLTFWSPNINIFRDPRWGRGMETYGEDPYLAGRLAVAFVRGMQGDDPKYLKTVATPKHYAVHSGPEPDRHTFDARIDEADLRDTYLPQFEAAVTEGGALSVMCAYNRFRGDPCCSSPKLLDTVLRQEWGFGGYVVSDCDAVDDIYRTHKLAASAAEASALALKGGCDLNCGTTYRALTAAVKQGLVTEREIDVALARLMTVRFRLGMFDPPERVRWASIPYSVVDSDAHRRLALDTARQSIVLLKNDSGTLPLSRGIRTLAVIGPNADDEEVLLGNYNGTPSHAVTPLEGLRKKAGSRIRVVHAVGSDWAEGIPAFTVVPASALRTVRNGATVEGLTGEYFDNAALKGTPVFTRIDPRVDFHWLASAPDSRIKDDTAGIRWSGQIVAPASGTYQIGGFGLTSFRIYLDDKLLVQFRSNHEPTRTVKQVEMKAGEPRSLRIEYSETTADARMQLVWAGPRPNLQRDAVEAARNADASILFLGLSPRLEGEEMSVSVPGFKGGDRVDITLPDPQQRLLEAVVAVGKPVVVVLLNGSALGVRWAAAHVPAIVEAWYPGQAAGDAIADVLFGDYNPGGRLPVTFYRDVFQLPPFTDYRMTGRTYRYFEGEQLFPFGHGLSYTRFAYSNLKMPSSMKAGDALDVDVDVRNIGKRPGDEVVQVYVEGDPNWERIIAEKYRPPTLEEFAAKNTVRTLVGFTRISLNPGERKTVHFRLAPRSFAYTGIRGDRTVHPRTVRLAVGGKQPGFKGMTDAATTGVVMGTVEIKGQPTEVK